MSKSIIIVIALAIILAILTFGFNNPLSSFFKTFNQPKAPPQINLTYWSLSDDEAVLRPLILDYEKSHPNITINFVQQSILNYRTRLQTQLRSGQGPDIFDIHSSWVPMFVPDLSPTGSISSEDYYPVIKDTLVVKGAMVGLPLQIDGMVMFVNLDILKAANIQIPSTWPDFVEAAKKVTVKDANTGQIKTSGAALGTTTNVSFWPEMLGILFLQEPNGDLNRPANQAGTEVLQFYTNFVTNPQNKTWDINLDSDQQMFENGRLAFYFAPSLVASQIKKDSPSLNFQAVPIPQLPGQNQIDWATFWAKGVSAYSRNSGEAWKFLQYLSTDENLKKLNNGRKNNNQPILPYPKPSLAGEQKDDPILGAVISQAPYFKAGYLNSNTYDSGINDEMIKVFKDMVDGALQGQNLKDLLNTAQTNIYQIFVKYGLVKPATSTK